MTKEEKVQELIKRLSPLFPELTTALVHKNALELLIATIMAAQTTDKLVNTLTPTLFANFRTAQDFAAASVEEIDKYISKVNFHRTKAANIKKTTTMLVEKFGGKVPDTMAELTMLPGVARKTANVVLGNVFGKNEGIVVDTHVKRLSFKLGLTTHTDPVKIEKDLMEIVPKDKWTDFPNLLILTGRKYCPARPHDPANCPIEDLFV